MWMIPWLSFSTFLMLKIWDFFLSVNECTKNGTLLTMLRNCLTNQWIYGWAAARLTSNITTILRLCVLNAGGDSVEQYFVCYNKVSKLLFKNMLRRLLKISQYETANLWSYQRGNREFQCESSIDFLFQHYWCQGNWGFFLSVTLWVIQSLALVYQKEILAFNFCLFKLRQYI